MARQTKSSRRALPDGRPFLTSAAVVPSTVIAPDPDRLFFDRYNEWLPVEAERLQIEALPSGDPTFEARFSVNADRWHDLMYAIMDVSPLTKRGLHAKATVLQALLKNHLSFGSEGTDERSGSPSEKFAWCLVNDMLTMAASDAAEEHPTVENLAKIEFPAMNLDPKADLMPRKEFLACASRIYSSLMIGFVMFGKDQDGLAAVFREITEAQNDDGKAVGETIEQLRVNHDWLAGYVEVLGCMRSRALAAAARMAMGE